MQQKIIITHNNKTYPITLRKHKRTANNITYRLYISDTNNIGFYSLINGLFYSNPHYIITDTNYYNLVLKITEQKVKEIMQQENLPQSLYL